MSITQTRNDAPATIAAPEAAAPVWPVAHRGPELVDEVLAHQGVRAVLALVAALVLLGLVAGAVLNHTWAALAVVVVAAAVVLVERALGSDD